MHKKIRIRKNKILLYYFLAIVLPSIVLGVLAYRGIVNDQAIREREISQQLTETGANIINESDLFISKTEKEFFKKNRMTGIPPPETSFFEDSLLSEFLTEKSVIEGIFYIKPSGKVQFLESGLLYFPDRTFNRLNNNIQSDFNNRISQAWEYEFQDKNYQEALILYQQLIKINNDKALTASLLIPVARIQKKMLDYTDAINTYMQIEQNYSHEKMNGGIPVGVIALMESARLYLTIGDTLNALKSTNYLISQTQKSHWDLEVSQFNQLISACNEIIQISDNCEDEFCREQARQTKSLLDELAILADNTSRQLLFLDKATIALKESGFSSPEAESECRVYMNVEGKPIYFSLFPESGDGQWGLIYNLPQFIDKLTQIIIPVEKQKPDFQWQLLKEGRELLSQSPGNLSGDIRITSVFPSYLPSWSLVLFRKSPGIMTAFFSASQGIFLYIFLLIVIGLALGLFFTLQIINKELALSRMKSDFISTVSHEFKSPLTSIRQMSEMLFNERIKKESRKKEYYEIMLEQSERLSHLIDNILDFSKIEEGEKVFRFEKVNLTELINHVTSVFQKSVANEGFSVTSSIPQILPELPVDKEAIQQVLYNLLDNAYKYSGESRIIEVITESTGGSVKISVKDFGIGIPHDDQDKIFDRFFRGGNELTRSVKGSGIGLTIVKRIIEAHRGTISLDSTPGKGSTFQVTLPRDDI
jgi:signal transduction histidine kinase